MGFIGSKWKLVAVSYLVVLLTTLTAPNVGFAQPGPNISNAPNSLDFGVVLSANEYETGLTYFTVTNNSGAAVTIYISGTDAIGGTTHTLSDTAIPGNNTFGLKAGLKGKGYAIIVKKLESYNILVSGLADGATQKWGLKIYTPTTMTYEDAQKTFTTTLSVVLD